MNLDNKYWDGKYINNETGWDISYASPPLTEYIEQLKNKNLKILIPGCGNAYEGSFLLENGFKNTFLIDVSETALKNFKTKYPNFPDNQIICGDFFEHHEKYDLIIEQTFFCAIDPNKRRNYAQHISSLLNPKGKVVGVLFCIPLNSDHPPFGGDINEYKALFKPYFNKASIEPCYNSIKPRDNNEAFIILEK